ncbi:hypothetical protein RJ640_005168 [Escallonia rubra]|uniref:CCHC-type domain-containing protein n=1 Tax=Escallonia rubra TaxID=112253 RepID=A0AA88S0C9_9ASTE|nr:hypothetical protein RJ640_005168 [Escallonia rubra]
MLMAANSARNRNPGESEAIIARYLIAGFTGQLRGWWDFYLTPTDQNNILNSIKIEPNGNPILINEQPLSDAVTTLVTAITKHFIGNASTVLERGRELLINLRCPTLTHFRWYKDVFLSKLYQRSDAQQDFWKERFIAGLPNLFSERVRTRIRNKHNGALPFSLYTFGELISEICAEGLVLCNDIKLKNQLKKEHKSGRTELGQFCYQFGYDTLSVPNYGTKEKVSKTRKPFRKPKFSKKYRKEESPRPFKRFSKRKSFPKSKVICHKCGKPGHYANKCYTKQKINELIIDEDLRKQLNEILLNPSDSEDNHSLELNNIDGDINSSCSSSNHSSDHEDTCHDCNSKTDYYKAILDMNGLSINVITSEESIILDLLDKIDDPEKKKQVIFKYLHGKQSLPTPNDSRQIPTIGNTFNFSTVMDRLQTSEPKGPTIQDLQGEILSLKKDVKTLSTRISLLELHNIEEVRSEEEEEEEIYLNDNKLKINPDFANDTNIPKEQEILSMDRVIFQKWYVSVKVVISKDFTFEEIALIDSGADLNCIKEGLVPTKYCETTRQALTTANNGRMKINYKISESWICNDGICLKTHFIVVRGLSQSIILGTPFLSLLNPMTIDDKDISIITDDRYGITYLNSNDVAFLLSLACAKRLEDLDRAATAVARLGRKCSDSRLNWFDLVYTDLKLGTIDMGKQEYGSKEMQKRIDKMERLISATSNLYTTLESLTEMEISEIKLKQWKKNTVAMQEDDGYGENGARKNNRVFHAAGPLTVRGSGLALRYANVILLAEQYLDSAVVIGNDARQNLYHMLPENLKTLHFTDKEKIEAAIARMRSLLVGI